MTDDERMTALEERLAKLEKQVEDLTTSAEELYRRTAGGMMVGEAIHLGGQHSLLDQPIPAAAAVDIALRP